MTREKFPEKIPFRLTRMLTNAMEVSRYWEKKSNYGIGSIQLQLCLKIDFLGA